MLTQYARLGSSLSGGNRLFLNGIQLLFVEEVIDVRLLAFVRHAIEDGGHLLDVALGWCIGFASLIVGLGQLLKDVVALMPSGLGCIATQAASVNPCGAAIGEAVGSSRAVIAVELDAIAVYAVGFRDSACDLIELGLKLWRRAIQLCFWPALRKDLALLRRLSLR